MRFLKMHGLGNDFVILDHRNVGASLTPEKVQAIADRNKGVGCDLVAVMEPSQSADFYARFYNADGSESGQCGNAVRCMAHMVMEEKGRQSCNVEIQSGILPCILQPDGQVQVDMGPPQEIKDIELSEGGLDNPVAVNVGNPHCVFFVPNAEEAPVGTVGPLVENNKALFPERTNVEFAEIVGHDRIRLRVWERGAGITQACGSGACATLVAAIRRDLIMGRQAEIAMDGGTLLLEWRGEDDHILMTGPVSYVFEGNLKE